MLLGVLKSQQIVEKKWNLFTRVDTRLNTFYAIYLHIDCLPL